MFKFLQTELPPWYFSNHRSLINLIFLSLRRSSVCDSDSLLPDCSPYRQPSLAENTDSSDSVTNNVVTTEYNITSTNERDKNANNTQLIKYVRPLYPKNLAGLGLIHEDEYGYLYIPTAFSRCPKFFILQSIHPPPVLGTYDTRHELYSAKQEQYSMYFRRCIRILRLKYHPVTLEDSYHANDGIFDVAKFEIFITHRLDVNTIDDLILYCNMFNLLILHAIIRKMGDA